MAGIDNVTLGAAQAFTVKKIEEAGGMTSEGVVQVVKENIGPQVNAYLTKSELASVVSELESTALKKVTNEDVVALDASEVETTNALANTKRWFLSDVIPIGATINKLAYHTYKYGKGTVTFEFWELDNDNLTKVYSVDSTASISQCVNVEVNYTASKKTMISFVCSDNSVCYNTENGTIKLSSDKTSNSLSYSELDTWVNFAPSITLCYVTRKEFEFAKKTKNVITVGQGCDYNEIQDALDSILDDTASNPYTILVYPSGTPYNRFSMVRKLSETYPWANVIPRYISIIGTDKSHCIIQCDNGEYTTPPAELLTNGIIKNMTFKMTNDKPLDTPEKGGYACHIDSRTLDDVGYNMIIEDCDFYSDVAPAVGIGLHANANLAFRRCRFTTRAIADYAPNDTYKNLYEYGCVFCHTSTLADAQNQKITFENCVGICAEGARSLWITSTGDYASDTSDFEYTLLNNLFWNESANASGYTLGTNLKANPMNYGNNI